MLALMRSQPDREALVIGASRGLGLVLANELTRRGWRVIATTRASASGELRAEAVEQLEMTSSDQLAALHVRLGGHQLDLLVVNAAIDRGDRPITDVSADVFTEVMITNAYSPLKALEALRGLVKPGGTI